MLLHTWILTKNQAPGQNGLYTCRQSSEIQPRRSCVLTSRVQPVKSHTVSLDTSYSPSDDESPPLSLPSSGHKRKRAPTPTDDELEALQSGLGSPLEYMKWAKANNVASMLPKDRKDESQTRCQSMLEPHLQPVAPKERIIPYTDDRFHEAAIQWLITTDQPISALEHPAFKNMINVAARASNGVRLPSRKVTSVVGYNRAGSHSLAHTCLHARKDDFVLEPNTRLMPTLSALE